MSPARRPRLVRAFHSHAAVINVTAQNTDTPILTHGRVGMSRVGTGCAWPGRLAAVLARKKTHVMLTRKKVRRARPSIDARPGVKPLKRARSQRSAERYSP